MPGRTWTRDEDLQIALAVTAGFPLKELAGRLDRTYAAVRIRSSRIDARSLIVREALARGYVGVVRAGGEPAPEPRADEHAARQKAKLRKMFAGVPDADKPEWMR